MSKFKVPIALTAAISSVFSGILYTGYNRSAEPSKFELAATRLGFSSPAEQEALLKISYLAGYFQPDKLWHDIVSFNKHDYPEEVFSSIQKSLIKAGADQDDFNKFDARSLRKNLFKNADRYDTQDVEDWLLYVSQNAFNRKLGQERNELIAEHWMDKYKDLYIEEAKKLNLINPIDPTQREYDEAWIAGASRIGLLSRILHYNTLLDSIKVNGNVLVLAGQRPLWANIDGINPGTYAKLIKAWKEKTDIKSLDVSLPVGENQDRTEEGKIYIADLAKRSDIKLNPEQPFIEYTKETAPKGYFAGRSYPNYLDERQKKLTESLMSDDLLKKFLDTDAIIVDTQTGKNNERPDTASTARDATENLIKRILSKEFGEKKDFSILFESNNPYITRQAIATQREVDKVSESYGLDKKGYHIKVEGIGFGAKQDVATIHSELAALIAEMYKNVHPESTSETCFRHCLKELLFQTREHLDVIPQIPKFTNAHDPLDIIGWVQEIFDYYT